MGYKHGGKRKGAGRKVTTGTSPRVTVSLTKELKEHGFTKGSEIKDAALWAVANGYKK